MSRKFILPVAGSLVLLASIPVLAASHGHSHGSIQHGNSSHTVVLPSQASTTAQAAVSGNVPISQGTPSNQSSVSASVSTTTAGSQHDKSKHHPSGQPASVKAAVTEMHALQSQIKAARLKYVAVIKVYIQTLSTSLATGQTGSLQTALAQLKTINLTLAQTVKTEMTAKKASASAKGSHGLAEVVDKFKAELAALTNATKEVQTLTSTLTVTTSTTPSTTTSTSTSTSTSSSTSGT